TPVARSPPRPRALRESPVRRRILSVAFRVYRTWTGYVHPEDDFGPTEACVGIRGRRARRTYRSESSAPARDGRHPSGLGAPARGRGHGHRIRGDAGVHGAEQLARVAA